MVIVFLAWVSHFQEFPPICISFQGSSTDCQAPPPLPDPFRIPIRFRIVRDLQTRNGPHPGWSQRVRGSSQMMSAKLMNFVIPSPSSVHNQRNFPPSCQDLDNPSIWHHMWMAPCGRGWMGPLIQDSLPTLDTRGDSSGQLHKGKPNRGMHKPGRGRTVAGWWWVPGCEKKWLDLLYFHIFTPRSRFWDVKKLKMYWQPDGLCVR